MTTKTPRTDAAMLSDECCVNREAWSRQLETELQEAKSQIAFLDRQVHINDEMLAGLEEAQTISDATNETIEVMQRLYIPISDVKPLIDTLRFIAVGCRNPELKAVETLKWFHSKQPKIDVTGGF